MDTIDEAPETRRNVSAFNINTAMQSDPLALANSDHPGMSLTNMLFNGGNYLGWRRQVRMALGAKLKLGFIDGTCRKPEIGTVDYERWIRCDYMVTCWILHSMVAELTNAFLYASSAKDLWTEIAERLGFIIDFLSKATLIGFMAGAAVIVSLQQLKGLLGIVHFTSKMGMIPVLSSVFEHKNEWSWQTILMGFSFLFLLLLARQISVKRPNLFWVSAAAPLTSVILSTLIVFAVKPTNRQVPIIGFLPKGINRPSIDMLYFHGSYLALAIKTGIVTGILSLTETIAVGRTFAAIGNYQVDGNKEMVAVGVMNLFGSFTSCYVTAGSFSRSAVNYNAGAQTAVSNTVMASTVLITMMFLMPLFYYTPNVILAAIIITAVIGLIDYKAAFRLWKVDKLDFVACLTSFIGVLFYSVPMGLAISVGISVFKILLHVTRPNTMALGCIPGTQIYQNLGRYKEAMRIPSFLILAVKSPIYFANSMYLQERVLRWVREEEDRVKANNESTIKCVILDMTAVTAIDTSGIDLLCELREMLERKSLQLVLVNPAGNVMEKLQKSKALELFGVHGLYLTVGEAVTDVSSLMKLQP